MLTRPIIVFGRLSSAMRAFIAVRDLPQKWRMTTRRSINLTGILSAFNRQKSAKSGHLVSKSRCESEQDEGYPPSLQAGASRTGGLIEAFLRKIKCPGKRSDLG
jgi:hypothetical protein